MAIYDVITFGHPTLRKKAQEIAVDEIDQEFIENMLETMYEEDGVGLAATQVNVLKRLVVVNDLKSEYVLINPKIIAKSEQQETDTEGCLSLPGFQAKVPRHLKIIVRALDREGDPVELEAKGLLARIIQHELDHLDGILYIDRAEPDSLRMSMESDESSLKEINEKELADFFKDNFHAERPDVEFKRVQPLV